MSAAAAFAFLLTAWESAVRAWGVPRPPGYMVAVVAATAIGAMIAQRWTAPRPPPESIARQLESLFPQTRGLLCDALGDPKPGFSAARVDEGRNWIERRGVEGLDRVLHEETSAGAAGSRRRAILMVIVAAVAMVVQPTSTRRVAAVFLDPAAAWRAEPGVWHIEPGNARIEYGGTFDGSARFAGPTTSSVLVVEWRVPGGRWRADSVGGEPEGRWVWSDLTEPRRYRLRYGRFLSGAFRVDVADPFRIEWIEARTVGGPWSPMVGQAFVEDGPIEIRGRASAPARFAVVRSTGDPFGPLETDGSQFGGTIRPRAGPAEVVVGGNTTEEVATARFQVVPREAVRLEIRRPTEDPAVLEASNAWLEVEVHAPTGLSEVRWEADDGRSGTVGRGAGARDTTIAAEVPLTSGKNPGDTVKYRAIAAPLEGEPAVTKWHRVVVADAATLRASAAEARQTAEDRLDETLAEVRQAALGDREEAESGTRTDAARMDRRLRAAADSLVKMLDRTLADPELDPRLAKRLEAYRRVLIEASESDVGPRRAGSWDPVAATEARASVLEAVQDRLEEIEELLGRSAAADTLEALASSEQALAARSSRATSEQLEGSISGEQARLDATARRASEKLGDRQRLEVERALEKVGDALQTRRGEEVASSLQEAADAMLGAADQTRREIEVIADDRARRTAALDRAGAETLFLAERQQSLVERHARPAFTREERSARLSRQRVVTQGLERALGNLVEAIGGRPAGVELSERLARSVFYTRYAERVLERPGVDAAGHGVARDAMSDAAEALALLARGFLVPTGESSGGGGPGSVGESGQVARQLEALAGEQQGLAEAIAEGDEATAGNSDAAATQREIGDRLRGMARSLEELGVEERTVRALAEAADRAASRLVRGLAGAQTETELRSLARRLADLGRMVDEAETERRKAEAARSFVPTRPPPLSREVTAPQLDSQEIFEAWRASLPQSAIESARKYLELLEEEGVRRTDELE